MFGLLSKISEKLGRPSGFSLDNVVLRKLIRKSLSYTFLPSGFNGRAKSMQYTTVCQSTSNHSSFLSMTTAFFSSILYFFCSLLDILLSPSGLFSVTMAHFFSHYVQKSSTNGCRVTMVVEKTSCSLLMVPNQSLAFHQIVTICCTLKDWPSLYSHYEKNDKPASSTMITTNLLCKHSC